MLSATLIGIIGELLSSCGLVTGHSGSSFQITQISVL